MRIKSVLVSFLVFIIPYSCVAGVRDLALPEESNVVTLTHTTEVFRKFFQGDLEQSIDLARKKEKPQYRIGVSVEEAQRYFLEYVQTKTSDDERESICRALFTSDYFGLTHPIAQQQVTSREKDRLAGDLISYLRAESVNTPALRRTSEKWPLRLRFLTPEEAMEAVLSVPIFAQQFTREQLSTRDDIFSSEYFGVSDDPEKRRKQFLTHPIGFLTRDFIERIFTGAQRIMDNTKTGDHLVIFGNSPYFIGRALKFLVSTDPQDDLYRRIIDFPFSGPPNKQRPGCYPQRRDLVTPERLAHLKRRMANVGLSSSNQELLAHPTYFIDVIGSGSGIAYMCDELLRGFDERTGGGGARPPDLNVISLNEIKVTCEEESEVGGFDSRNASIARTNARDSERVIFHFPSIDDTHFKIDGQVIYVPGHALLDMLPSPDWRIFPEYNACYWYPEYDHLLPLDPSSMPKHTRILLEYFDTHIEDLLAIRMSRPAD